MFNESPVPEDPRGSSSQHQSLPSPSQSMEISTSIPAPTQNLTLNWFEQHVLDSIIPPTTRSLITLIWMTEAFDHFNDGHFELEEHLSQAQPGLLREWNRRNREAKEREASKTNSRKRGAEDTPGPPIKRDNHHAPVAQDEAALILQGIPPLRKYDAIYTIGEVEDGQVEYYPGLPCSLMLSFGDGNTMRGAFHLADYSALLFFEKRPLGLSNDRFLEDGTVKGRLDKFRLKFEGRREGDDWSRSDYRARTFWFEWNRRYRDEKDDEMMDDLSTDSSEDRDMEE
ncbi:hypothetical protein BHE90_000131 [Fusarium euwallaceae]|uniref:Uncharacterized protein n=2 Tax=Fusarium solani species complex TaxID=232080 RepID=A0A430MBG8_9HYPO|nr:hypothetical protein CEP51_005148 [Fusarium floridanum]RTE85319.1 hypothetical protein BHE90_000131 [Fusarium euwallaceae]